MNCIKKSDPCHLNIKACLTITYVPNFSLKTCCYAFSNVSSRSGEVNECYEVQIDLWQKASWSPVMNITKSRRNIEFQLYSLFTDYVIDFQNEARNANKMASFSKECVKRSTGTAYHCYIPLCNNDSRYDNTRELSFH